MNFKFTFKIPMAKLRLLLCVSLLIWSFVLPTTGTTVVIMWFIVSRPQIEWDFSYLGDPKPQLSRWTVLCVPWELRIHGGGDGLIDLQIATLFSCHLLKAVILHSIFIWNEKGNRIVLRTIRCEWDLNIPIPLPQVSSVSCAMKKAL